VLFLSNSLHYLCLFCHMFHEHYIDISMEISQLKLQEASFAAYFYSLPKSLMILSRKTGYKFINLAHWLFVSSMDYIMRQFLSMLEDRTYLSQILMLVLTCIVGSLEPETSVSNNHNYGVRFRYSFCHMSC
jgi:hypothetical protein